MFVRSLLTFFLLCWASLALAIPGWRFDFPSQKGIFRIMISQNTLTVFFEEGASAADKLGSTFRQAGYSCSTLSRDIHLDHDLVDHGSEFSLENFIPHIHFAFNVPFIQPDMLNNLLIVASIPDLIREAMLRSFVEYFRQFLREMSSARPLSNNQRTLHSSMALGSHNTLQSLLMFAILANQVNLQAVAQAGGSNHTVQPVVEETQTIAPRFSMRQYYTIFVMFFLIMLHDPSISFNKF